MVVSPSAARPATDADDNGGEAVAEQRKTAGSERQGRQPNDIGDDRNADAAHESEAPESLPRLNRRTLGAIWLTNGIAGMSWSLRWSRRSAQPLVHTHSLVRHCPLHRATHVPSWVAQQVVR